VCNNSFYAQYSELAICIAYHLEYPHIVDLTNSQQYILNVSVCLYYFQQ